jgi:hypothetical protein
MGLVYRALVQRPGRRLVAGLCDSLDAGNKLKVLLVFKSGIPATLEPHFCMLPTPPDKSPLWEFIPIILTDVKPIVYCHRQRLFASDLQILQQGGEYARHHCLSRM